MVFIPFAAPGELVLGRVTSVKKDFARAVILEIVEPGRRVTPQCPWFGTCGGCDLQHIDYQLQLATKTNAVKTTLKRIGGISPEIIKETLPTRPWQYRNKLQMPVAMRQGKLTAGFYKSRSKDLVAVETCAIQQKANDCAVRAVINVARETGISAIVLQGIMIRCSAATGETLLVLEVNQRKFSEREAFLKGLKERIPHLTSLVLWEKPEQASREVRDEVVWGAGYIIDVIGSLKFKVSPHSFWQVNSYGVLQVYQQVKEYARLSGAETVLDIYCGVGSIGLFLAGGAKEVIGIESNASAIQDTQENAVINDVRNARFHKGSAEIILPQMVQKGLKADVVVMDPPRRGCAAPLLEAVTQAAPERIVYVSCNPATLARDLRLLGERGYRAREVQPIDMFPQTSHVECVVLMSKVQK